MIQFPDSIRKNIPVVVIVMLYILADMILTSKEIYLLNLVPVFVFIVYLAIARIDIVYYIIIACTPISIQLLEFFPSLPLDFAIPTEPLLFGVLILLIYRTAQSGMFSNKVFNHPVTYAILFNLFWMLVTSV